MINKIIVKNIKKSIKDYALYFITLVLAVSIFYMFNSIDAQKEIMDVTKTTNESMKLLSKVLGYISVFVSVVLGFLIIYANNFFIKKRKKEIGIYETLGMKKRKISKILICETFLIAIIALLTGLAVGILLSQYMSLFTAKIFEADLTKYKFVFSLTALIKSTVYFGIIFLFVMIFNTISISRFKLIDLIYGHKKNEKLRINNNIISIIIFIISIICLSIAYYQVNTRGLINMDFIFLIDLVLGVVGTLLFFLSITGFFINVFKKNKKLYYKELNLFTIKQVNSKINTNFISMSVVSILLLLTIGILSCGISMEKILSSDLRKLVSSDNTISKEYQENIYLKDIFKKELTNNMVKENVNFTEYVKKEKVQNHYKDIITFKDKNEYFNRFEITFVLLSDLNKIRNLENEKEIFLENDKYLILNTNSSFEEYAKIILNNNTKINLNNEILTPKRIVNFQMKNGGENITIVVNDFYKESLSGEYEYLNINLKNFEKDGEKYNNLIKKRITIYNNEAKEKETYFYNMSRYELYLMSISSKALVSFLSIYLGIVFLITSAAVLAIQQLSESADNKERYLLLNKLGASKKMTNKALFKQIAIYFFLPLLLAIVHSIFGLMAANNVIKEFGKIDITRSILITAVTIIIIYGIYFLITYFGSKNIINDKNYK